MTRKQNSAKHVDWKAMMAEQQDFLRPLIREVLQQVMEAEMKEALGAGKGERTKNGSQLAHRIATTVYDLVLNGLGKDVLEKSLGVLKPGRKAHLDFRST